jgi:hypothetical protein
MKRRKQTEMAAYLDQAVPLKGASHADVVSYSFDIPMRYAECYAVLADGQKVRLKNARQFMGWSGPEGERTLLFRNNGRRIVIDARARHQESVNSDRRNGVHKFVARDGSLLFMRRWGQELAKNVGDRMPIYAMPALSI